MTEEEGWQFIHTVVPRAEIDRRREYELHNRRIRQENLYLQQCLYAAMAMVSYSTDDQSTYQQIFCSSASTMVHAPRMCLSAPAVFLLIAENW